MDFDKNELIKSCMNYTGGKFKLLSQMLPLFPKEINTFVDLFAGGLNVSINIKANKIIANDIIVPLIDLYCYFKNTNINEILLNMEKVIEKYLLSKSNLDGYLLLRKDYNLNKDIKLLFPLMCYCYNNQIRFNNKWEFNRHFGKDRSSFNDNIKNNLIDTHLAIKEKNIIFTNKTFEDLKVHKLKENDLVYVDPPYLITKPDYSKQAEWNEEKEIKLLNLLDNLNSLNLRFALSNVLYHNEKSNEILINWSKKYNIHCLDYDYKNSNADKKDKCKNKSLEVLITNY